MERSDTQVTSSCAAIFAGNTVILLQVSVLKRIHNIRLLAQTARQVCLDKICSSFFGKHPDMSVHTPLLAGTESLPKPHVAPHATCLQQAAPGRSSIPATISAAQLMMQ